MPLEERMADLDEIGSVNPLAKALENMSDFIKKSGEKWAPKGSQANTETKHLEPSVTPKSKTHSSMGGKPEAKRAVPEDENEGGYDELDEPDEGEGRIKRARNKAKASVPSDDAGPLRRSFTPDDDSDYDGDDGGDDSQPDVGGESPDGMPPPPADGDESMDPQLMQLMVALKQNPQLVQVLMGVLSGGAEDNSPPSGMPGGAPPPPQASMGGGAPPPPPPQHAVPPHTHEAPPEQMQRSLAAHAENIASGFAADPRRQAIAEAVDASPALEAFLDSYIEHTAKALALIEQQTALIKGQGKRLTLLEEGMHKSMQLEVALAKSMSGGQQAPKARSEQPEPPMPSPGVYSAFSKAMTPPERTATIDKEVMAKSLKGLAQDGDRQAASLLAFVDVPVNGLKHIAERCPEYIWKRYQETLEAAE